MAALPDTTKRVKNCVFVWTAIPRILTATVGLFRAIVCSGYGQRPFNGDKIPPDKVVMVTRSPDGKIVWLETGNEKSGLQHIINEHGRQFNRKGILNSDIPNYVLEAVYQGNIVGTQGKYEQYSHNTETHRL